MKELACGREVCSNSMHACPHPDASLSCFFFRRCARITSLEPPGIFSKKRASSLTDLGDSA
jgi:hypothetical protein